MPKAFLGKQRKRQRNKDKEKEPLFFLSGFFFRVKKKHSLNITITVFLSSYFDNRGGKKKGRTLQNLVWRREENRAREASPCFSSFFFAPVGRLSRCTVKILFFFFFSFFSCLPRRR